MRANCSHPVCTVGPKMSPAKPQTTPATTGFTPTEVIVVASKQVMCDGGGGALGHPRTYYDMGQDDFVVCGYCDRRFVLAGSSEDPST